MPGKNLTRDEADERARLLRVDAYRVTLDLSTAERPDAATFRSTSTIGFSCAEPGASTFLDLIAPQVLSVQLNGRDLDPAEVFADSRIRLDGLEAENTVTVVAECAYSRSGQGLHRFFDPQDEQVYLYTQFEPADARRLYANFEQPDLKASFVFDVTVPAGWHVSSNGAPVEREPVGDDSERWSFTPTKRISTYITAVVAGPYHVARDEYSRTLPDGTVLEIPLAVLCRAKLAAYLDAEAIFDVTKRGLDFFHDVFDYPYPFGKYDQAFVPEYNLGAMENPGCVTFAEEYIARSKVSDSHFEQRANTILHEMAHMWFGDLVTMRWWDDLWLKESFAEFMGAHASVRATRWTNAWVSFASRRKDWAYRQDQLPTTHPVKAQIGDLEDAKLNFDGITYAKGAAVLKQLVAYVGEEAFLEGSRRYFKRHAYGSTELTDLLAALEEASGRNLTAWSKAWLETAGVDTLGVTPPQRPHRIAIGTYAPRGDDGQVVRIARTEIDVTSCELTGRGSSESVEPGTFVLLNDDDLSYCKIRFDHGQLAFLLEHLSAFADPMPRSLAWSALWNMVRDAELPGRQYLVFLDRHAAKESKISVVENLHRRASYLLDHFLDGSERAEAKLMAATMAARELRAAEAGSDHQLAWARFFAEVATRDEDFALLEGLLDGSADAALELEGLAVDTDLRWTFVQALAAAGRVDEARIAAEAERDNSAKGRVYQAGCLAARPDPAAKALAWQRAVESGDQPSDLLGELLSGMAQADQADLLRPLVEPYFAALDRTWTERTIENAERVVSLGFPALLVEPETLARTDAWLESGQHAPALRRLVLEARDDLTRAMRARNA
jgi:aminopeptidase N